MNINETHFYSSLKVKQPITIFCIIIVIASLSTYFILQTYNSSVDDIKRSYLESAVHSIGANMGIQLRQTHRDLTMTASLPSVLGTVARAPEPHKVAAFLAGHSRLQAVLDGIMNAYGYYDSLYLTNEYGEYIIGSRGTRISSKIGGEMDFVVDNLEAYGVSYGAMLLSTTTDEYLLPMVLKVSYADKVGALVASIRLNQMIDTAIHDTPHDYIASTAIVVDHSGIRLIDNDKASILPDNYQAYYPELLSQSSGIIHAQRGKEQILLGFYNVPDSDIYIIGIVDSSFKAEQINAIRHTMGLTSVGMALVTLLAVSLFSSPITRDIVRISDFAQKIAQGEQEQNIDVHRNDELGSLARNLEHTVGTLVDLVARSEAATKAKSDFLARMSHEIRTPMNGIMGMTYLAMRANPDEKQKQYLVRIDNAAKSLLHIINDILDFSKIEAQKMDINPVSFRLRPMFSSIHDLLLPKCAEKSLMFTYSIEDDVPEVLKADPVRLTQICTNLCSNSVKFTTRGAVHLHACVVRRQEDTLTLAFSVNDTGIGMTKEEQQHIFESFTQADGTTTRKYGGTGLGLAICKSLTELMGGSISVESERGVGSTFTFTIEASIGDVQEVEKSSPPQMKNMPIMPLDILLVEDNEINQAIALEILKDMGATVTLAHNGQEAVHTWENGEFDIILMDIQMPVMDGLTAAKCIRQSAVPRSKTVPILAMTAHAMTGDKEKSLEAGMNDHITKPIAIAELRDALVFWGAASKMDTSA